MSDSEYTEEELLSWIDSYVEVFGVVPTYQEMESSPGPSGSAFQRAFGTWVDALNEAGYEPRNPGARGKEVAE